MELCDQKHILKCSIVQESFKTEEMAQENTEYEDIFSEDILKQKTVTALLKCLLEIRKSKLEDLHNMEQNPSTTTEALRRSINVQPCIVYSSFGKLYKGCFIIQLNIE